jgi:hypothetical protein
MYNEEKFIDMSCGLELDEDLIPNHRQNENGIYFLTLYYMLKQLDDSLTCDDLLTYKKIVENIRTYGKDGVKIKGLYDRGADESLKTDKDSIRKISHDNINAIACFSKVFEKIPQIEFKEHIYIKEYGVKNLWRFDNAFPDAPRWSCIQHPRDWIMWSYLGGSLIAKLFIFEPMLECVLACWSVSVTKPDIFTRIVTWIKTRTWPATHIIELDTSGKLLSFCRLYTVRNKWFGRLTFKICTWIIKKRAKKNWQQIFAYYFGNVNHPINKVIESIYKKSSLDK